MLTESGSANNHIILLQVNIHVVGHLGVGCFGTVEISTFEELQMVQEEKTARPAERMLHVVMT